MKFTADEQNYLNNCADELSKDAFLNRLDFHLITVGSDSDAFSFLSELKAKILTLSDDSWAELQDMLPFQFLYGKYDTEEFAKIIESEEER